MMDHLTKKEAEKSVKEKPKWPMQRLKSMYFAMHCWKYAGIEDNSRTQKIQKIFLCKKFERPMEEYS